MDETGFWVESLLLVSEINIFYLWTKKQDACNVYKRKEGAL